MRVGAVGAALAAARLRFERDRRREGTHRALPAATAASHRSVPIGAVGAALAAARLRFHHNERREGTSPSPTLRWDGPDPSRAVGAALAAARLPTYTLSLEIEFERTAKRVIVEIRNQSRPNRILQDVCRNVQEVLALAERVVEEASLPESTWVSLAASRLVALGFPTSDDGGQRSLPGKTDEKVDVVRHEAIGIDVHPFVLTNPRKERDAFLAKFDVGKDRSAR